jgi:methylphosphotriester-DNA--protein-cysteine methyltransferase
VRCWRACVEQDRADRLARAAVGLIERSGGTLRIEELARSLGVSRQHLALQFRERVGLNMKTFAMVCRFRGASAAVRDLGGRLGASTGPGWRASAGITTSRT